MRGTEEEDGIVLNDKYEENISLHEEYKIVGVIITEKAFYLPLLSEDCKNCLVGNFAEEGKELAVLGRDIKFEKNKQY